MKNIVKFSYLALVSLLMMALNACTDDYEYTAANAPGNEVYFDNALPSTIEIDKEAGSFDVTLCRIDDKAELTVPLTFEAGEGNIFIVPSSVSFAAGEKTTNIHITYNPDDVKYGTYTGGTIKIAGSDIDTTYGISSYTFNAGATEWADIATNGSIGSYREDCMTTFFKVDNVVYDVKIQKSVVNEGMYRMVNPYGKSYPYNEPGDYDDSKDYYMVINAKNPNAVYVEQCHTGMAWSEYGEVVIWSLASYYINKGQTAEELQTAHPEYFGTLEDGVITMPKGSLLIAMLNYNDGGLYNSNVNGKFAIALPGAVIADYSAGAAYMGRFTDTKDNDFAQMALTFGKDVASIKYALVPQSADVDATVQGIIDGSIEAGEATEAGTVQVAYDATGKYNFVMVVYNAGGEAVGASAVEVKLQSSKDAAEQFAEIAAGTFTIGAKDQSAVISQSGEPWGLLFDEKFSQEAILSQSQSDPTRFKLTPYLDEEGEYPLYFTMSEDGTLVVEEVETGIPLQPGMLLATDIVTFFGPDSNNGAFLAQNGYGSTYNKEAGTFNFNIIYTDSDGSAYGFELETFEVTSWAETAAMKNAMRKAMKAYTGSKKQVKTTKHFVRKMNKNAVRFK